MASRTQSGENKSKQLDRWIAEESVTTDDKITKEQLNLIYNNTNDMIFMIGVEGPGQYRSLSVNRRYLEATGVRAREFLNRPVSEVFSKSEYEYVRDHYNQAVSEGVPHRYETRASLASGTVYLETTLVPIFEGDRCTHLIGVSRDITERKLERKALQAEKDRAENYLNIAEAIIVGLDATGKITLLNKKGYQVLGYPQGTLTGEDWIQMCMNPDKQELLRHEILERARLGSMPERTVTYVYTREGERRLVRWSNSPVFDQHQKFAGILSSGEDITDRREAEKSMIASQRVLAAGEIAAAVAHDFNNALQGILGSLQLALLDDDMSDDSRAMLETASTLANDAAGRIQLLQRLNTATQLGDSEPVDINPLISDVVAQTQHLWRDDAQKQGRQIVINTQLGAGLKVSHGQPGELRSVLFNLVKNSIEAIEDSGEITIKTWHEDGSNFVSVTDSGKGMDDPVRQRIFQPFFSTKGFEAGRGLGLSASYAIARAHQGDIRVKQSSPGGGTTMELRLPVIDRLDYPDAAAEGESDRRSLHVLWVDDDPAVLRMAEGYLEALAQTGDTAESGEAALELLDNGDYDVVITDIGMPGMNGFELAHRVSELTSGTMPVLALTGWGQTISQAEQAQCEIHRVLPKPISIRELGKALAELPDH